MEKVYLDVTTPLDTDDRKFFLEEVQGKERLSGLFHYTLRLRTRDHTIDFNEMVDKTITVTIEFSEGKSRYLNGVVTRFIQAGNDEAFTIYYAEIRPWFWKLTLTSDSKIHQARTVPEIISAVFSDLGFTDFKDRTTGTHPQREYCVQYQESAFDFVSRLMEDEGIFYFFEHTKEKHTLVLADDADAHRACPGLSVVKMRAVEPENQELISRCRFGQQVISNKYAAEDFNFETPDTDLLAKVDGAVEGNLEIYEYPGGFGTTDNGETIADLRIEACEQPQKILQGEGFVRSFTAGYTFDLTGHDRQDLNTTYVLLSVSLQVDQERYANTFEAFPATIPFRPPLTTKKPKIFGTQTAIVVGKRDEEIWTDKYGRVTVQFHWDRAGKRNENSSCWVRVGQVWAGKTWGTFFVPRIGTEVIVSFLEGNPDRPIIIGTVYNAKQAVPYTLPDDQNKSTIKTRSTKQGAAGNEIRFDDTKDSEELYVHAQKDFNIMVENDWTSTVDQNRTTTIQKAHETLTVEKGNRIIKVNTGNETHEVKGTRTLTITDIETHTNKADFTQNVSKNFTLNVDGNLIIDVKGTVTIKAGKSLTNKAGTSLTNQAGTDLTNKATTSMTNDGGVTLTNKASASQTVDGGGMLNLKGGLVKIN